MTDIVCSGKSCCKREGCANYIGNKTEPVLAYERDLSTEGSGGANQPSTFLCGDASNGQFMYFEPLMQDMTVIEWFKKEFIPIASDTTIATLIYLYEKYGSPESLTKHDFEEIDKRMHMFQMKGIHIAKQYKENK